MEQKAIWELFDLDKVFDKPVTNIPDWIDPREPDLLKGYRTPMPEWIQELADWSMKTGNYKKIDKLLDLALGDYNTPWTTEQIDKFKYGDKYTGLSKYKPTSGNIISEYIKAISPKELYHRDKFKIFDKFDLSKAGVRADGRKYIPNWGHGAYTSIKNDPSLDKYYGKMVSKFFQSPEANLISPRELYKTNFFSHPYFKDEPIYGNKFQKYLKMKGYSGIDNDWERVFYEPNKDLLPANAKYQRLVNRLFNNNAVKYGSKILNRIATPLMILDGIGLNQPIADEGNYNPHTDRFEIGITN